MLAPSGSTTATDIRTDYMTLLITQLRNQNPLEPMKNAEMTSQLAQLAQLEQMESMTGTFKDVLKSTQRAQAAGMIGKKVGFFPEGAASEVAGTVEGIEIINDQVHLRVDDALQYTRANKVATEDAHLNELNQTYHLDHGDTISVYGIKVDGERINDGYGAQIPVHDGWDFLTLGELVERITGMFNVDGEETSLATLKEGKIRLRDKGSNLPRDMLLVYNPSGKSELQRFDLPKYSTHLPTLEEITIITEAD